jgi:hypothetical protein
VRFTQVATSAGEQDDGIEFPVEEYERVSMALAARHFPDTVSR